MTTQMAGTNTNLKVPDDQQKSLHSAQPFRRNSLAIPLLVGPDSPFHVVGNARRRLSNVSDVVSRKISHTIGWRSVSASVELTVSQGSSLCAQYIRNRLKRSGIFQRKLGLKRMRSAMLLPGGSVVGEVYPELTTVGSELEKMHPNLFTRIGRQIGSSTFTSEQSAAEALTDISREMLRSGEMTWSKIIALYAVAGGIAVDCVRQGKPEFIPAVQRAMTEVLEEDLASWIQANGGWSSLVTRYRPAEKTSPWQEHRLVVYLILTTIVVILLSITIRSLVF
ncbi:bcl-2-related ovarian killer protein-like [Venturia canescens]|uniref:bcl-2-related ovarian killer protein-like n=1 Tax=Venturia canescens TaxID=32260 RepID=UPI001C9C6FCF|nr:bcl-2-related ovarian killer protein-like [Venturia canescens]XP_043275718.1 bcl-2-related ovarian killer protein-like [Venturia canescens]